MAENVIYVLNTGSRELVFLAPDCLMLGSSAHAAPDLLKRQGFPDAEEGKKVIPIKLHIPRFCIFLGDA